jgi:hypothetical protein
MEEPVIGVVFADNQVLFAVVLLVAVDVVDRSSSRQGSAPHALDYEPVGPRPFRVSRCAPTIPFL